MARRRINVLANRPVSEEKGEVLKTYYASWRKFNRATNAPFVALYNSFKDEHLATLDPGPLRLYLYFSFHANNTTGHSWHSIQTMAKFFNTQTRTIDNWIKTLVDKELIYRERTDKLSNTTFLIPYTNTMMVLTPRKKHTVDDQNLVDDLVSLVKRREELYGEIIKIHHLFQWKLSKGKVVVDEDNHQFLLIMTRRKNGVVISHIYRFKNLSDYGVNEIEIDDIATFKSPFLYESAPIKGIAINPSIPIHLNKHAKDFSDLLEQFEQAEEVDLDIHPRLDYGLTSEILKDVIEEAETEEDQK